MSTKGEKEAAEPVGEADSSKDHTQGIKRFAQYTSPVMLAMLASTGKTYAATAA